MAVHDLIDTEAELWLAMELVDGFDVSELVRGGGVPVDIACMIGLGVVRALEAAHRAGIVHRDVKPQNVIVSRAGVVKLMDFGVARDESLDTLTKTGGVVGTPSYLAPELLKGQPSSPRSDLYAVGALMYELLSGKRVFAHATPETIWGLVATGKFPRLGKLAPHVPWRLTLLVERCLKTDPKRRLASASELKQVLEHFLSSNSAPADEGARLVSWLCAIGKIVEAEALTIVGNTSLFIEVVPLKPRSQPWRRAALAMLVLTVGLGFVLWRYTDVVERVLASLPPSITGR